MQQRQQQQQQQRTRKHSRACVVFRSTSTNNPTTRITKRRLSTTSASLRTRMNKTNKKIRWFGLLLASWSTMSGTTTTIQNSEAFAMPVGDEETGHQEEDYHSSNDSEDEKKEQEQDEVESPFIVIVDGGSTSSRVQVFEFVVREEEEDDNDNNEEDDQDEEEEKVDDEATNNEKVKTTTMMMKQKKEKDRGSGIVDCIRRGSARSDIPLSIFARDDENKRYIPLNPVHVAEHMISPFQHAASIVPARYHSTTSVRYAATAGMRLFSDEEQDAVYDALYEGLMLSDADFVFQNSMNRKRDIITLSGEDEGLYGAIAVNYILGVIDTNMQLLQRTTIQQQQQGEQDVSVGPIGALDMGGSSTQIVFLPSFDADDPQQLRNNNDDMPPSSQSSTSLFNSDDFFSTSYLSYGVDQFRTRLWDYLIQQHQLKQQQNEQQQCDGEGTEEANDDDDAVTEKTCSASLVHDDDSMMIVVDNPCAFPGYPITWGDRYKLIGTGDALTCAEHIRKLIPHPLQPSPIPAKENNNENDGQERYILGKHVGGIEHPPIRGAFYAMSLYFFTLDSLRELSGYELLQQNWPTPTLDELHNATFLLCKRSWYDDLYRIRHTAHQYTRIEVLPLRCFESVYMITLLRDGFGFPTNTRDITYAFEINNHEVEWTIGMAIALRKQQQKQKEKQQLDKQSKRQRLEHPSSEHVREREEHDVNDEQSSLDVVVVDSNNDVNCLLSTVTMSGSSSSSRETDDNNDNECEKNGDRNSNRSSSNEEGSGSGAVGNKNKNINVAVDDRGGLVEKLTRRLFNTVS